MMRRLTWFAALASVAFAATWSVDTRNLQIQDPERQGFEDYDVSTIAVNSLDHRDVNPLFPHKPGHRPTGFVALGDSYSAGIGTSVNETDEACRRGDHAHAVLLNEDLEALQGANRTSFEFLSCTGAAIDDVLLNGDQTQIGQFNTTTTADFALLSIGGNDLGFFDIMNSCIFRFYSFYSGTCKEALRKADEQLASPAFETQLRLAITEILDRVQWEKRPWFTVTITGYARFFNADTTACDDSSFGVWWRGPKLKRKLRRRMNEMVLAVNDKIRRSVDAVNAGFAKDKVFFVDYDAAFEGHRFCEPNITEPDYQRNETWFFLVGGNDNAGHVDPEQPRFNASDVLPPSSPLINPDICMEETTISRDWGQRALCMMAMAREREPDLRTASGDDSVHGEDMWYVPTYYGQTFHPVGRVWNQKPSGADRRSEQRDTKPLGTQYTAAGERSFSEYRSLKTLR